MALCRPNVDYRNLGTEEGSNDLACCSHLELASAFLSQYVQGSSAIHYNYA
jgi:hypothetical protein